MKTLITKKISYHLHLFHKLLAIQKTKYILTRTLAKTTETIIGLNIMNI
jgi:hypothetical protein